jgi:ABC-type oligopeptide transport system substrate-binding subunit
MKRLLFLGALAACGLPDGEYFGDVPSLEGRDLKHLRYCNSGEPETVDPAIASTTTAVKPVYALFDGLYRYDADGMPEPSLALSMDSSPDLRRFTFHLRRGARWSNGREVTAYDFQYQVVRTAHPLTASPNADGFFVIKGVEAYLGGKARVLVADAGGLPAGTIVDVEGNDPPDTNARASTKVLALRDLGAAETAAYARVPRGTPVTIVEISGRPGSLPSPADGAAWAYVFWNAGDTVYGWVPLAELDVHPGADVKVRVIPVRKRRIPGLDATVEELAADDAVVRTAVEVPARSVLQLPEALGVRVPDPYTLVVETHSPTPYLIHLTPQRGARATPREAVSRWPRRWVEPGRIVVSGAMTLTRWLERDHMLMERNPSYWDAASIRLEKITWFSIADQAAISNYYFTGGCDATTTNPVPATYMPVMTGEKRNGKPYKDFIIRRWLGTYYALVNTKKFPNRHFRRALSYAIDRQQIVNVLKGGQFPNAQLSPGKPIEQMTDEELALCGVTRDHPGVAMIMIKGELCYVPPPGLGFDVAKAKEELAAARAENGVPAGFTYRYNAGSEAHKLIGEYLQQQWHAVLGVDVKLESQEWKTMVAVSRPPTGDFEVMRFGVVLNFPSTEAETLPTFRCTGPDNRPQWCNPAYEAALDAAEKMGDQKARLAKIYEAEQLIVEDAALLPLYTYTQQMLMRPYVKGLPLNDTDQVQVERAWLDPDWNTP